MPRRPLHEQYRADLLVLHDQPLNFDPERRDEYTPSNGWYIDNLQTDLYPEPPGPPIPGGPWDTARHLLREHGFVDPKLGVAIFLPDAPLLERVVLTRGRWFGMPFQLGTRVGAIIDERRATENGMQQVWGYTHNTLAGQIKRGQMELSVIKWLDSGRIVFRISSYSQVSTIANPLRRAGFRLFARHIQLRILRRSLEHMRRLVLAELRLEDNAAAPAQMYGVGDSWRLYRQN